ncbi:D-alanine--D-alanine ligase [Aerococcus sanguinicola]|uniref:D-alanine--D-alanine ligase n=1 Tax=Aerococcus sanguinicola TaxID=119206 RepID=A0A0X8FBR4_9LACT|nr:MULTISPECIES: D-alanine--D-alanine ligase [Aerococcus]AMB94219.1 D-alanine--D-alanine ligase [Aerococcus sanguinicola]MDK7050003.1 D-alanine--D-alanine ligase [Aerococcus sanguinicola]OFT92510.1 D-alanine--D-alanine ligase A [Aerococcus sp. HMSC23C02]PKZ22395.1 D-alanine--D-alanine ligase [Aerococcus sanguinicola]
MRIVLLYGGDSAEHDISVLTAASILKHLDYKKHQVQPVFIDREGQWIAGELLEEYSLSEDSILYLEASDQQHFYRQGEAEISQGLAVVPTDVLTKDSLAFPALHGPNGEDGTIQGLFEALNVPYTGAGVLASAAGMDKIISKQLFQQAQIPQVPFVALTSYQYETERSEVIARIEGQLVYPVFIKPANMGSSVGITQAQDRDALLQGLETAFHYDTRVVVEQGIEAREIEVAVLGNEEVQVSQPGEIVKDQGFYDYEEKYINNSIEMAIPADLPEESAQAIQAYAKKAYLAIDGSGLTRCDFFVTHNMDIYINEVNTMPGFTQFSMYPSLWAASGLSYEDLLEKLLKLALERFNKKQGLANQ